MPRATLLSELRLELARAGDPDRALKMQRYMKSLLPYYGVPMPLVRAICKRQFAKLAFADTSAWQRTVLGVWKGARFREELYAALALCGLPAARPFQTMTALPLYERPILCQLGAKANTDLDLLYDCIRPSLGSKEFFLQKAIGWALRQVAWTNPKEIRRYVKEHAGELSALSKREALKNL